MKDKQSFDNQYNYKMIGLLKSHKREENKHLYKVAKKYNLKNKRR